MCSILCVRVHGSVGTWLITDNRVRIVYHALVGSCAGLFHTGCVF